MIFGWRAGQRPLAFVPLLAPLAGLVVMLALPYPALHAALEGPEGARLLDRGGRLLATLPGRDGSFMERLPPSAVPATCREIFVRLEDRRFFTHPGVDPLALGRAILQRAAGRGRSGASTITMQLARLIAPHPRTVAGKLLEMAEAVRIEVRLSKERILLEWLNRLPFGRGAVGIGAAARTYFDVDLGSLSVAQLVVLALIPRNPSRFDPFDWPERLLAEAERVTQRAGLEVDRAELEGAIRSARRGSPPHLAPHFERTVVGALASGAATAGRNGELKTTLDLELNRYVESRIRGTLAEARTARVTNAAVVAIENATGAIVAWVGSQDFSDRAGSGQVDGVLIRRQSASTLKPFLYALALERGWTAASLLPDIDLSFAAAPELPGTGATGGADGRAVLYRPTDFDGRVRGVVRLRTALASSLNIPAVYLLSRVGTASFLDRLRVLGFEVPADAADRWGLGMAIGNAEVSLLELTRAFAVFARGGSLPTLEVLERADGRGPGARAVCDPRVAWLVADILSDPAARAAGFGTRTWFGLPFPAMFKSGTSSEFTDLWCIGATPEWTVGAWAGNFDGRAAINKTGSSLPARIVADVLVRLVESSPSGGSGLFPRPAGVVEAQICAVTGGRATGSCPTSRVEYFLAESDVPAPCAWHAARGSQLDLLYSSLLGEGGTPRIVLPVDGSTFWLDARLAPGAQQVPVMIAVGTLPGTDLVLSLDGRELRRLAASVTFALPASRGEHRLELLGSGVHEQARYSIR